MTGDADTTRRGSVCGTIVPPGDKSITHRALFLAALNRGSTIIRNASTASDCTSTRNLLELLGYHFREKGDDLFLPPTQRQCAPGWLTLDCGNSGTTARLAAGFLTGEPGEFTLVGDESLMRRPMDRVIEPLARLGASITSRGGRLPVTIHSSGEGIPGDLNTVIDVASAQVHTALLLAGIRSRHGLRLARVSPMRDHTIGMLREFGVEVLSERNRDRDIVIDRIDSAVIERDVTIDVPGDISSAAFFIAAAVVTPGSDLTVNSVGLNPTRLAFVRCLQRMGADLEVHRYDDRQGEPVGDITARYSPELRAVTLTGAGLVGEMGEEISIAEMIDELPLLALVAARADGTTSVTGAGELRVKESDRISATVQMLRSLGVTLDELPDGFRVTGPQPIAGDVRLDHRGDHRLAMLAGVAALIAAKPVSMDNPDVAAVSYPDFWSHLADLTGTGIGGR